MVLKEYMGKHQKLEQNVSFWQVTLYWIQEQLVKSVAFIQTKGEPMNLIVRSIVKIWNENLITS